MTHSKTNFREGLESAVKVGAEGIQVYAVRGEMAHGTSTRNRAEKRKMVEDFDSRYPFYGDLGGHGFMNKKRILRESKSQSKSLTWHWSLELYITTHIGVVPEDKNDDTYKIILEACSNWLNMQTAWVYLQ